MERIINDLKQMRDDAGSQRKVAKKAGINYGKIQRLEKRITRSLKVADMAQMLQAYGKSMAVYFGELATIEELEALAKSEELWTLIRRALMDSEKRNTLLVFLKTLFPAPKPRGRGGQ